MEKNAIHEAEYWGMEWQNQPKTLALLQEFRTVLVATLAQKDPAEAQVHERELTDEYLGKHAFTLAPIHASAESTELTLAAAKIAIRHDVNGSLTFLTTYLRFLPSGNPVTEKIRALINKGMKMINPERTETW